MVLQCAFGEEEGAGDFSIAGALRNQVHAVHHRAPVAVEGWSLNAPVRRRGQSQTRFASRKEKRCVKRLNRKIVATAQVLSWLMRAQKIGCIQRKGSRKTTKG